MTSEVTPGRAGGAGHGRPIAAGTFLGLGLGGFVDGIVLHQMLQWHHMVSSAGAPPTSLENLRINTYWDGVFHALTWALTVAGVTLLWTSARRAHPRWPLRLLPGGMVLGWGLFTTIEGVVNHHLLGLHHVNETAPPGQWWLWDLAFVAVGVAMIVGGLAVLHSARSLAGDETGAGSGARRDGDRVDRHRHAA